jgi:hypothetical protein
MNGLPSAEPVVEWMRILGGRGGEEIQLEGVRAACLAHRR